MRAEVDVVEETFEEKLGSRLDGLYAGALFLAGGDEFAAEGLLVDAVRRGFRVFRRRRPDEGADLWFDGQLVRAFRRSAGNAWGRSDVPAPAEVHPVRTAPGHGRAIDFATIARAAAKIPPLPRGAVWLVVLRRWSYAEAARLLDLDPVELPALLAYRRLLAVADPGGGGRSKGAEA